MSPGFSRGKESKGLLCAAPGKKKIRKGPSQELKIPQQKKARQPGRKRLRKEGKFEGDRCQSIKSTGRSFPSLKTDSVAGSEDGGGECRGEEGRNSGRSPQWIPP